MRASWLLIIIAIIGLGIAAVLLSFRDASPSVRPNSAKTSVLPRGEHSNQSPAPLTALPSTGIPVAIPAAAPAVATPLAVPASADGTLRPETDAVLAMMKDTRRSVEERTRELAAISRGQNAAALNTLKTVADAHIYMNHVAVETMGNFAKSPEKPAAQAYLSGRLSDPDSQIACAAIRAYGRLMGDESIPELAAVLKNNRERPDGHEDIVCSAAVKALRDTGSAAAVPALVAELARSEEKGWSLEYGSTVLDALRPTATAQGRAGAAAYAERLSARIPDDKLARAHFEQKIAEARNTAGQ